MYIVYKAWCRFVFDIYVKDAHLIYHVFRLYFNKQCLCENVAISILADSTVLIKINENCPLLKSHVAIISNNLFVLGY